MVRHAALALALWMCPDVAFACSCVPEAYAPACQRIGKMPVAFLGTVVGAVPHPGYPDTPAMRVHRLRVDAVYKGLPPKTTEIAVDAAGPCGMSFRIGEQYVVFGNNRNGVIATSECAGTRPASWSAEDIRFLGNYAAGRTTTEIYGRVLQWLPLTGWPRVEEDAPVPGAVVTLLGGKSPVSQRVDSGGNFRIQIDSKGPFSLTADSPQFGSTSVRGPLAPAPGTCVQAFPLLQSGTVLAGMVRLPSGAPAAGIRIELLRQHLSGTWYATTQFWANSDKQGHFRFENLPSGNYLLGHEIHGDRPSSFSPYPVWYYPGASTRTQAQQISLGPKQRIENVDLRLPPAHQPRKIRVQVVWPDGSSPTEHLLQLSDGSDLLKNMGGLIRGKQERHNSTFEIDGYQERTYHLNARYWIDDLGGPVPRDLQRIAKTEIVEVKPGKQPVTVRLILSKRMPADEDR